MGQHPTYVQKIIDDLNLVVDSEGSFSKVAQKPGFKLLWGDQKVMIFNTYDLRYLATGSACFIFI